MLTSFVIWMFWRNTYNMKLAIIKRKEKICSFRLSSWKSISCKIRCIIIISLMISNSRHESSVSSKILRYLTKKIPNWLNLTKRLWIHSSICNITNKKNKIIRFLKIFASNHFWDGMSKRTISSHITKSSKSNLL